MTFSWFTSKTIWGAIVATFGYLAQPEVLAVLPKTPAAIVTGIGVILSVTGARQAIAKNGQGK